MRQRIADELKAALKGGDKPRTQTLRMVNAAIQDRDIANRGAGKPPAGDDEVMQVLAKMVVRNPPRPSKMAGGRSWLPRSAPRSP